MTSGIGIPAAAAEPVDAVEPVDPPEPAGTDAAAPQADGDDAEVPRFTRASLESAGRIVLPYWFAAAGVALGIGGVIQDKPLAGACGAVAGVTAGLLYQGRARHFRRQAEALRDRLRHHRAESETVQAELRESVRTLRTEVWELRLAQQVAEMTRRLNVANSEPSMEIRAVAEALPTQPLDLSELPFASRELRDQPEDGEPEVVESSAVLPAPKPEPQVDAEVEPEVVEPEAAEPETAAEVTAEVMADVPPEAEDELSEPEIESEPQAEGESVAEVTSAEEAVKTEQAEASDVTAVDDSDDDQLADGKDAQVIDLHGPAGDGDKRVAAKKTPAKKVPGKKTGTASGDSTSEQDHTAVAG